MLKMLNYLAVTKKYWPNGRVATSLMTRVQISLLNLYIVLYIVI